ncbi:hypothetical protein ScPMuIL_018954 [Solemya velum]
MADRSYAKSIELPPEDVFRNLKNASRFAIDIGGSLAKLAYCSTIHRRTSTVSDEPDKGEEGSQSIYQVSERDAINGRLHFVKFETKYIEHCLNFVHKKLLDSKEFVKDKCIKATGGGAHKYTDLIRDKLGVQVDKEDEISCLIKGCNFLLKNIPDEAYLYQRHASMEYKFQGVDHNIFPYLLINIGSGVSLIKVESEDKFERIGGTSTGGGTFWGLGSLLTKAKTFDELLDLAEKGDHRTVDMLVKDIYGGAYSSIGLPAEVIASSFGKAARSPKDSAKQDFREEDIARSLLLSISNDIGQIAYLHAKIHNLKKIYFGGYFIRGHQLTMHTITFAINFWSKGEIQALFLRHEGYLGAIGAFLKGAEELEEELPWGENFAGSSGLISPKRSFFTSGRNRSSTFDKLELDQLENRLTHCPLLLDHKSYFPDTVDLIQDPDARSYWLDCFAKNVDKTVKAIHSQPQTADSTERAEQFRAAYLQRLKELKENPYAYGSLTVRSLLDTSSHCLEEFKFTDPWSQQKQMENEAALKGLKDRLIYLDGLPLNERQLALACGLLAGNVFDWGASEVAILLETGTFCFAQAEEKLQVRPWLFDDFDKWSERLTTGPAHKCAVIFCDNSGPDIILGVFPFVRELLNNGTKCILCANSRPTINDVTYNELLILVKRVAEISQSVNKALLSGHLQILDSGQGSPCLDLRLINCELVDAIEREKADLIVLEGMGRAVHTNFDATFSCEVLKVAVIKNRWLANRLGGDMFSVMFKYEKSRQISALNNDSGR